MKDFGFVYPAKLQRHARSVLVRFPDFPEALTEGADEHDALVQAADCLEEAIAGRIPKITCSNIERCCNILTEQTHFLHLWQCFMFHSRINVPVYDNTTAAGFHIHDMWDSGDIEQERPQH